MRLFTADDRGWRDWLAAGELSPLHVEYERMSDDHEGTVRAVLAQIGVEPPEQWSVQEPIRRQSDATSIEWVAAYHRDRAERGLTGKSVAGVDAGAA